MTVTRLAFALDLPTLDPARRMAMTVRDAGEIDEAAGSEG
jgi:hypothetical protein